MALQHTFWFPLPAVLETLPSASSPASARGIIAECAFVAFYASRVPCCCRRYRCWRCRRALGSWARLQAQCHRFLVGRGRRDSGLLLLHLRLLDLQVLPLQLAVATSQVTPRLGSSHRGPRRSPEAKAVCVTSPAQRCSLGLAAAAKGLGSQVPPPLVPSFCLRSGMQSTHL